MLRLRGHMDKKRYENTKTPRPFDAETHPSDRVTIAPPSQSASVSTQTAESAHISAPASIPAPMVTPETTPVTAALASALGVEPARTNPPTQLEQLAPMPALDQLTHDWADDLRRLQAELGNVKAELAHLRGKLDRAIVAWRTGTPVPAE